MRQAKLKHYGSIISVSERAILSHEAGTYFILDFTIKWGGKYSVLVGEMELFFSLFGEIHVRQGGNL